MHTQRRAGLEESHTTATRLLGHEHRRKTGKTIGLGGGIHLLGLDRTALDIS